MKRAIKCVGAAVILIPIIAALGAAYLCGGDVSCRAVAGWLLGGMSEPA